jgi:toxin ParE1/3/4
VKVVLALEAKLDLESIVDFIAWENPARAASFALELDTKARELGDFPHRFPLIPDFATLGIRRRKHGNYLIVYRVETDRVLVMRVLHAARDYPALLDLYQ